MQYIPLKDDIEKMEADRIGGTELVGEGDADLDIFSLFGPHLEHSDFIFQTEGKVQDHSIKCVNFANDLFLGADQGDTELLELQVRLIIDMILVQSSVGTVAQHHIVRDHVYLLTSDACFVNYMLGPCVHLNQRPSSATSPCGSGRLLRLLRCAVGDLHPSHLFGG